MHVISSTLQECSKQIKLKNIAAPFAEFLHKHSAICHVVTVRNVGRFVKFQIQLFSEGLLYCELHRLFSQNMCIQAYKTGDKANECVWRCVWRRPN